MQTIVAKERYIYTIPGGIGVPAVITGDVGLSEDGITGTNSGGGQSVVGSVRQVGG